MPRIWLSRSKAPRVLRCRAQPMARMDSTLAVDDPVGEPRHRHMAYDPVNKHLFVANRAMNRVEVSPLSTNPAKAKSPLPAPAARTSPPTAHSLDWHFLAGDRCHRRGHAASQGALFARRTQPLPERFSIAPWKCFLFRMARHDSSAPNWPTSQGLLALWDPVSNSLTNLTSMAPVVFQTGHRSLARTAIIRKLKTTGAIEVRFVNEFETGSQSASRPCEVASWRRRIMVLHSKEKALPRGD